MSVVVGKLPIERGNMGTTFLSKKVWELQRNFCAEFQKALTLELESERIANRVMTNYTATM